MKKLIVANWKMNKKLKEVEDFFSVFKKSFSNKRNAWISPQAMHLTQCLSLSQNTAIKIGAQNASQFLNGAYTGELSCESLKDLGVEFVILGHSERRAYFQETSKTLNAKITTALKCGLKVIYCVGETLSERELNQTLSIIEDQLHQGLNDQSLATSTNLVIAYEPVWAIGTGKTATSAQAQEVHAQIRSVLKNKFVGFGEKIQILYGGSVKPENIEELLSEKDIDGALVGGASLKAKDFLALCGEK